MSTRTNVLATARPPGVAGPTRTAGLGARRHWRRLTAVAVALPLAATLLPATASASPAPMVAVTAASQAGFWDVPAGASFHSDITWLVQSGITTGYPDGSFRASGDITREAMAAFLFRSLAPKSYVPPTRAVFTDVPVGHPFYREVSWLAATGVTTGYADGSFGAGGSISRQALAAFLYRLAGQKSAKDGASFVDTPPGHAFHTEIGWLAGSGITTGYVDRTFRPAATVSRGAMAAFLHRYTSAFGTTPAVSVATPATPTRPAAAPGSVKPGPSNTGVPAGTVLKVHNGNLEITTPGTVIDGMDIRGFVKVKAAGVVIRNSIIRGMATSKQTALVSSTTSGGSVTIEDSELYAASPSPWIDGVRGWNITARRVNVHHVIDPFHLYGDNVRIESSWLHDNVHFKNDPNHGGTPSHDDSIQIQKGKNIRIIGNNISGAFNTGIQFTQDQDVVSDVQIAKNWLDGGGCTINMAEKGRGPFQGIVITDNTFGRNTRHANCAIISPTTTKLTTARNYYTDGAVATVRAG